MNFKEMQDLILAELDLDDSASRDNIKRYINMARQVVHQAAGWPDKVKEAYTSTAAPYVTGTVSVTQDSATVTGSGTTFTSAMVDRWFTLDYGGPSYRIKSVESGTSLTLHEAYVEDTASAQGYYIYQDIISLKQEVQEVVKVWVEGNNTSRVLDRVQDNNPWLWRSSTSQTDMPWAYSVIPDHPQTKAVRIKFVHKIPDDEYRIRYRYTARCVDLSDDNEKINPTADRDHLVFRLALSYACTRDHSRRAQAERSMYEAELSQAKRRITTRTRGKGATINRRSNYGPYTTYNWSDLEI